MYDGSQGNAMTEVALALAMGFFSLLVLALVSMGAGRGKETSATAAVLAPPAAKAAEAVDWLYEFEPSAADDQDRNDPATAAVDNLLAAE